MDQGSRPLLAALAYFLIVFAAAFALGTVRVAVIAPRIGALWATALEVPIVLAISWPAAAAVMRRAHIAAIGPALIMGGAAFVLLMIAEAALAVLAFGQTVSGFLANLVTVAGALGLAGQIAFGLIPVARLGLAAPRRP